MAKKIDKDLLIGIDIGGTKVKLVLIRNSKVLAEDKYYVKDFKTSRQFLATLIAQVELMIKSVDKQRILGIGVGLPGIVDKKKEKVLVPPNLTIIQNINFKKVLENKFNIPVRIQNDAKCMALGEMLFGAGKNKQVLLFISLGTGVGGGLVFRNKEKIDVMTGFNNAATEFGHMIINFNGIEGRPKKKGELEQYAAGKFLLRRSLKNPIKLQQEALAGSQPAIKIYEELGYYLGIGIANLVNIFDPELVVIGGGISEAFKLFNKQAKETACKYIISPDARKINIVKSELQDRAGAIGAASLWLQ